MIIALPLVCRGKNHLSRSVISPSCASALSHTRRGVGILQVGDASEQMPGMPSNGFPRDGRHQLLRRPQTAQSIRNRDDTQRKDNRRRQPSAKGSHLRARSARAAKGSRTGHMTE